MKKNRKLIIIGIISIIIISCVHIFKPEGNDICMFYQLMTNNPDYKINNGFYTISANGKQRWFSTFTIEKIDQSIYKNVKSQDISLCYKDKCEFKFSQNTDVDPKYLEIAPVLLLIQTTQDIQDNFKCQKYIDPLKQNKQLEEHLKNFSLKTTINYKDGTTDTDVIELLFADSLLTDKSCGVCHGKINTPLYKLKNFINIVLNYFR